MNDTRFPVSVHDFVTKEKFVAEWLVRQNSNTALYLGFPKNVSYEVSGLILPSLSFLGIVINSVWLGGDQPQSNKAQLFRKVGYPIQVDTSISGTDVESWFSLLKSPVNYSFDSSLLVYNCRFQVEDVSPLQFSETIETWVEVYEKEIKNAKDKKSS